MFWTSAGITNVMFTGNLIWHFPEMAIFIIIGIGSFFLSSFAEQEHYIVLKEETLILDYGYLKQLSNVYQTKKRIYIVMFIPYNGCFSYEPKLICYEYHSFVFLKFYFCAEVINAYELLIKNEQYSSRLLVKIKSEINDKINNLLFFANFVNYKNAAIHCPCGRKEEII